MKEHIIKLLTTAKMEFIAPGTGCGIGIITGVIKLAAYIPAVAGITGIVLGILSYRLKKKVAAVDMEYKRAQIKYYNENDNQKA